MVVSQQQYHPEPRSGIMRRCPRCHERVAVEVGSDGYEEILCRKDVPEGGQPHRFLFHPSDLQDENDQRVSVGQDHATTREALADYAHAAWSGWMSYLFSKCRPNPDGSITIPVELVERWSRQVDTPYRELSGPEQDSDRKEADKMLEIVTGDGRLQRTLRSLKSDEEGWLRRGHYGARVLIENIDRILARLDPDNPHS